MTIITIKENEKLLRQTSKPVDIKNDSELKENIKIIKNYCNKNNIMALSAIQIGIPKRIIYLKNTNLDIINKIQNNSATEEETEYNEKRILINPIIVKKYGLTEYWEACASCQNYVGLVQRPYGVVVKYFDEKGEKHQDIFEGFESTVLSHEIDHLNGILFIDKAKKLLEISVEERKKLRQKYPYKVISKK